MRITICIYTLGSCGKIFSQARNSFRQGAKRVPLECVKSCRGEKKAPKRVRKGREGMRKISWKCERGAV